MVNDNFEMFDKNKPFWLIFIMEILFLLLQSIRYFGLQVHNLGQSILDCRQFISSSPFLQLKFPSQTLDRFKNFPSLHLKNPLGWKFSEIWPINNRKSLKFYVKR